MKQRKTHSVFLYLYCIAPLVMSLILIVHACSSVSKEFACSAGDPGSIPRLERSPGEGKGNPFQYTCLENSTDRGAWVWHKIVGLWLRKVEVVILVPTTSTKQVWLRILEIICKTNKEGSGRWREKDGAAGDPEPPKPHNVPRWLLSFLLVSSVPDWILQ